MNNIILPQVNQSVIHILNDRIGLYLIEYFLELESILEVALVTQLSDDVAVAIRSKYLVALEDTRVVQLLQNLDLLEQQLL